MVDKLPPVDGSSSAKPSRLMRTALLLSLAVNVAIVFAIAGFALSGPPKGGGPRGFDIALGPVAAALQPEERREIRDRLRGWDDIRPLNREEVQSAIRQMTASLRVEPFDPAAVEDFFAQTRLRSANLQQFALDAVIEKIAGMNAEERAVFAGRLEEQLKRRGRGQP